MYNIKTLNNISSKGLERLSSNLFAVDEEGAQPDGILVRSADLLNTTFNDNLLAIARAAVADPPVLILDEATSAADPENQVEIDRAIENLCRGKTVVIVAHRLGAIKLCDKVAVVENNTITCCGTHEEVLEKNEYYRRAWADYRAARAIAYSVEGGVQHA